MVLPPRHPKDPLAWNLAIALAFLALAAVRLTIPSAPYFDEVHYLPAARAVLDLSAPANIEHPPLGKQILALGIGLLGDRPIGWRIMPLLFGTLALLGAMRAMWFASGSRGASVLTGLYLVAGFPLLVQTRIAMLDIFMVGFVMLALWMLAAAVREAERARPCLAVAGAALGAAMACKWNAVPVAMLPGIAFLVLRLRGAGIRFLTTRRGGPVPGITLAEAFVWLGLLPLAVYAASYWPFALFERPEASFTDNSFAGGLLALHREMLDLQSQLKTPHPYQSNWWQWVSDWRPIWYLYEVADGAQRGVLLVGNPLAMLAGLPALGWCAWAGWTQRRGDAAAIAILYAASLGLWIVAPKPVQFYYHYFLPSCFLLAALAIVTRELWMRGHRVLPAALVAGTMTVFAFYYPILSAGALDGDQAFLRWAFLPSWR